MNDPDPTQPAAATRPAPLEVVALAAAIAAGLLVVGGILFVLGATERVGSSERFRQLGNVANPFVASLGFAAVGLVSLDRLAPAGALRLVRQRAASAAFGIGAITSLAVVVLALSGLISDFTGYGPGRDTLVMVGSAISRLATIVVAGVALWLAAVAPTAEKQ